ncbi:TetR/AcrR family transcriptional regulator [Breoghania sp. L-A4]|uniref:TetR/AcrR family transcriptional regulator n=1 Tax=Breoghania sp. L-A4 TaxID=2304600 RepID=UPI0020C0FAD7|nr:TetR/AcrR family transcriptional regulator [Breoghania sp. L-A4]
MLNSGPADKITTNEIARNAGISIGSLYQFFPGRRRSTTSCTAAGLSRHWSSWMPSTPGSTAARTSTPTRTPSSRPCRPRTASIRRGTGSCASPWPARPSWNSSRRSTMTRPSIASSRRRKNSRARSPRSRPKRWPG